MMHRSERGAVSTEYGLLALLIGALVTATVLTVGQLNRDSWQDSCTKISTAIGGDCQP